MLTLKRITNKHEKKTRNMENAFQTKMWYSNLGKFRRVLVFVAEKVCVSEGFG